MVKERLMLTKKEDKLKEQLKKLEREAELEEHKKRIMSPESFKYEVREIAEEEIKDRMYRNEEYIRSANSRIEEEIDRKAKLYAVHERRKVSWILPVLMFIGTIWLCQFEDWKTTNPTGLEVLLGMTIVFSFAVSTIWLFKSLAKLGDCND